MTDVIDRDGFRANVGIILMDEAGRLFLGRRTGGKGWQFPQGGMRRDESAEESLFRELHEEIGLSQGDVRLLGATSHWLRYRLPARYQRRGQRPLCVGQKQRWFLLQLAAAETAIRLDATGEPEFDRWRWVDYWQPVKEVIYFKRPVYVQALHELAQLARPEGLPPYPSWWARQIRQRRPAVARPGSASPMSDKAAAE
jgi:putative (di)nucleoside polyphosphate hydrolase